MFHVIFLVVRCRYESEDLTNFRGQEPDVRIEVAAAQRKITIVRLYFTDGGGVRGLTPSDLDKYDFILGIVSKINGETAIWRGWVRVGTNSWLGFAVGWSR